MGELVTQRPEEYQVSPSSALVLLLSQIPKGLSEIHPKPGVESVTEIIAKFTCTVVVRKL